MMFGTIPLLLLAFGIGALAQDTEQQIPFQTKDRDACVMSTSGQGEIRLKIECKNQDKTTSCQFTGKPSYCRAYNKDNNAFWKQLSQDLQKMSKPCEARVIKHSMCPRAPSQSQFKPADPSNQQSDTAKPEKKPPTKKPVTKKTTKKPAPTRSKVPDQENPRAMKIAKEHCSWFFQKFCSYVIEIFVN
ncbi:fibroblast growth factor-binding protein 2 [Pelodytes ibericus]